MTTISAVTNGNCFFLTIFSFFLVISSFLINQITNFSNNKLEEKTQKLTRIETLKCEKNNFEYILMHYTKMKKMML